MGNEAIALGAIRAGVDLAAGYPGTPSSEILETIAREKPDGVYVEWSTNEKTALEVAAGAAQCGALALVTMKQVGLNVASDPLLSLNYIGVKGGLVIVVADDPGPISSQTEQDTRSFAQFAKLAVFDPSSPEEAYAAMSDAFALSRRIGRPVLFRPTTRVCHGYADVETLEALPRQKPEGFTKDGGKWVIFPKLAYDNHILIEKTLAGLSDELRGYFGNSLAGSGKRGVAVGGVSYAYIREALAGIDSECNEYNIESKLLKVGVYPMSESLAADFLQGLDEAIVIEELDPVIERELTRICGKNRLGVKIRGKATGDAPNAGENSVAVVSSSLRSFFGLPPVVDTPELPPDTPVLPARPPVLCAGCPHRASFFAVKEAAKGRKAVFSGDIGCYTLGNAQPLEMVDTCLCMGAGIAMAQGIRRVQPDVVNFAFIGDSTFFHTGLPGIVNAVYNQADVIIAVLDNSTTAMTGGQPHPGIGRTIMGKRTPKLDIYGVVSALGAGHVERVNAFDLPESKAAVSRAIERTGVRVVIFEGACVNVARSGEPFSVGEKCSGCGVCRRKLGCPAIAANGKKVVIDADLCAGCGVCADVCPFGAISKGGGAA